MEEGRGATLRHLAPLENFVRVHFNRLACRAAEQQALVAGRTRTPLRHFDLRQFPMIVVPFRKHCPKLPSFVTSVSQKFFYKMFKFRE
jgi:hypothetical protein